MNRFHEELQLSQQQSQHHHSSKAQQLLQEQSAERSHIYQTNLLLNHLSVSSFFNSRIFDNNGKLAPAQFQEGDQRHRRGAETSLSSTSSAPTSSARWIYFSYGYSLFKLPSPRFSPVHILSGTAAFVRDHLQSWMDTGAVFAVCSTTMSVVDSQVLDFSPLSSNESSSSENNTCLHHAHRVVQNIKFVAALQQQMHPHLVPVRYMGVQFSGAGVPSQRRRFVLSDDKSSASDGNGAAAASAGMKMKKTPTEEGEGRKHLSESIAIEAVTPHYTTAGVPACYYELGNDDQQVSTTTAAAGTAAASVVTANPNQRNENGDEEEGEEEELGEQRKNLLNYFADVWFDILSALQYVHSRGFVARCVSPIAITYDEKMGVFQLDASFGVAVAGAKGNNGGIPKFVVGAGSGPWTTTAAAAGQQHQQQSSSSSSSLAQASRVPRRHPHQLSVGFQHFVRRLDVFFVMGRYTIFVPPQMYLAEREEEEGEEEEEDIGEGVEACEEGDDSDEKRQEATPSPPSPPPRSFASSAFTGRRATPTNAATATSNKRNNNKKPPFPASPKRKRNFSSNWEASYDLWSLAVTLLCMLPENPIHTKYTDNWGEYLQNLAKLYAFARKLSVATTLNTSARQMNATAHFFRDTVLAVLDAFLDGDAIMWAVTSGHHHLTTHDTTATSIPRRAGTVDITSTTAPLFNPASPQSSRTNVMSFFSLDPREGTQIDVSTIRLADVTWPTNNSLLRVPCVRPTQQVADMCPTYVELQCAAGKVSRDRQQRAHQHQKAKASFVFDCCNDALQHKIPTFEEWERERCVNNNGNKKKKEKLFEGYVNSVLLTSLYEASETINRSYLFYSDALGMLNRHHLQRYETNFDEGNEPREDAGSERENKLAGGTQQKHGSYPPILVRAAHVLFNEKERCLSAARREFFTRQQTSLRSLVIRHLGATLPQWPAVQPAQEEEAEEEEQELIGHSPLSTSGTDTPASEMSGSLRSHFARLRGLPSPSSPPLAVRTSRKRPPSCEHQRTQEV